MDIRETNRAKQLPIDKQYTKGVKLIDIDSTIASYMENHIIPEVEQNNQKLKFHLYMVMLRDGKVLKKMDT